jgi:hypothetical protein
MTASVGFSGACTFSKVGVLSLPSGEPSRSLSASRQFISSQFSSASVQPSPSESFSMSDRLNAMASGTSGTSVSFWPRADAAVKSARSRSRPTSVSFTSTKR